ncbi:MAG: DUF4844 domain-containing protein [Candidatus Omnitrophota bacterium]
MDDQKINVTPEVIKGLSALRAESKFHAEDMYPGSPSEDIRISGERAINAMLDRLQSGLKGSPRKSFVLSEFMTMLKNFENEDTEEREQACGYCERVMDLLGIEGSDGLLNKWLYDIDPDSGSS